MAHSIVVRAMDWSWEVPDSIPGYETFSKKISGNFINFLIEK
jgi:hypothetical protein